MKIVVLKETASGELRVALTPQSAGRLTAIGAEVLVEAGLGSAAYLADADYAAAGAVVAADVATLLAQADLLLTVQPPPLEVVARLPPGAVTAGFLDPFFNLELIGLLQRARLSSLCLELVPRTTYAQKLDALSSQASLAGYAAVVIAAERSSKAFPMMSTPAGTIQPARVFVVGAGVAGLQAIATAKRLGARVEAYDTRPVVKEEVLSLGARFVDIDLGETGQTSHGYALALSEAQLERQRAQMTKVCAAADVVITTAQVFGREAPKIISAAMVAAMRPGSVIVDLAAASGGNVEGTVPGEEIVTRSGVTIVGLRNFPAEVARDASQVYAANLQMLVEHAWDAETKALRLDTDDQVVGACLLTHQGEVRDQRVRVLLEASP